MRRLLESPPFAQPSITGDVVCEHALAQSRCGARKYAGHGKGEEISKP
jgi:hypothetical protein